MKKAILLFLLFQLFAELNAQNFVWVRQTNAEVVGNAIDNLGNRWIAGNYKDSAKFEDTTIYSTGQQWQNTANIFLAKYAPSGKLIYVKQNTGNGYISLIKLHKDNASNLYLIGAYEQQITFGNFTLNGDAGIFSYFIAKYDSAGNVIWLKNFPSLFINFQNYLRLNDIQRDVPGSFGKRPPDHRDNIR